MTDFKERLKLELRSEVPFTKEVEDRIMQNEPRKKKKIAWPMLTSGAVAIVAAALFFLFQTSEDIRFLHNATDVSTDFDEIKSMLIQSEVKVPLLEEVGKNQKLVTDADAYFSGLSYGFNYHDVIVEEITDFSRGDYVLIELENGDKVVRQLVGFGGETYKLEQGNVFINDKQLILPGFINGDAYLKEGNYRDVSVYFEHLPNNYDYLKDNQATLAKDELLIRGIKIQDQIIDTIAAERVIGKVVGVQEMTPTFVLTGETAATYESFKKSLDTSLLVGLDPVTMLRMYKQAEMEQEFEVLHALMPSTVSIHNYSLADIKNFFNNPLETRTKREIESMYASLYNNLVDAKVQSIMPKTYANVEYYYGKVREGYMTQQMHYNAQGFWEFLLYN